MWMSVSNIYDEILDMVNGEIMIFQNIYLYCSSHMLVLISSENHGCLLISTKHGLSLCQWNLVWWELMDYGMWKFIAWIGLPHVSCEWVFSKAQM